MLVAVIGTGIQLEKQWSFPSTSFFKELTVGEIISNNEMQCKVILALTKVYRKF